MTAPFGVAALPEPSDPRWRYAEPVGDGDALGFLPLSPPFLPHIGSRLRWLRATTRIVLLADGYPARVRGRRLAVHPIDGRYLLDALLDEQEERPRRRLRPYIARTAAAIVGRAEPLGDALVLRYRDTASSIAAGEPHVSALAQAYAARSLARAAEMLDDPALGRAADRFFDALLVTVEDGGTLYRAGRDVALATVPAWPPELILNGWLSGLVAILDFAALRDGARPRAHRLVRESLRTLRRLLPAYDVPRLHLSRYGLTGPLLLRIGLAPGPTDGIRISRLRIAVPGQGERAVPRRHGGRWVARAYPEDTEARRVRGGETLVPLARGIRLIGVLSRASHPEPNRLRFRVRAPHALRIEVTAHIGRYDPTASATVDRGWVPVASALVEPGTTDLDLPLPFEPIDLFAYPTNFTRGGPGHRVNTYHATHILRLRQLAAATGDGELRRWADRWAGYIGRWAGHPEYRDGECWTPEGPI